MIEEEVYEFIKQKRSKDDYVLSIYLDTHNSHLFTSKLKKFFHAKTNTIEKSLDQEKKFIFEQDKKRAWDFLKDYRPGGHCLVLFVNDSENFLWARELKIILPDQIVWRKRPSILPLLETFDECERYGVILVDKFRARLFIFFMGEIEGEYGAIAPNSVSHLKTTGRDNLRSQKQLQRTEEIHAQWHFKHIAEVMRKMAKKYPFDRLLLGGSKEATDELQPYLTPLLRSKVMGYLPLPVSTPSSKLIEAMSDLERNIERGKELGLVKLLMNVPLAKASRTLGVEATLHALEKGQIHQLVYSEQFSFNAARCPKCQKIFYPTREMCGNCHEILDPVEDLLEEMTWQIIPKGGKVEQVRGEAARRLHEVGGIGAILRQKRRPL